MPNLRILWLIWRCYFNPLSGGEGVHLREVGKRLVKSGHTLTVYCSSFPGASRHQFSEGIEFVRKGGRYSVYLRAMIAYATKFRGRYDVVIDEINTLPFFTPLYVREPRIAFVHQLGREVFLSAPLNWVQSRTIYAIEPTLVKLYANERMVTVSESTRRSLIEIGIDPERIRVIYNGVSQVPHREIVSQKDNFPHVVYLGRIVPQKGVHLIVQAISIVKAQFPNIVFSICGRACDNKYERYLKWLCETMGLADNVKFLGFLDEKAKTELLCRAHVFAIQSVREGFGLAPLESMACGTPVVGSNVPGLNESVLEGITGFLTKLGDIKELVRAITQLLNAYFRGEEEYREISQAAVGWARQFSWDKSARELETSLIEAVNQHSLGNIQ